MQVTGFGKRTEYTAFARVAKGSEWNLEFPTPNSAFKYDDNNLLVSTIEQGGRMRYVRIKLKEKKQEEEKKEEKSNSGFTGFQLMSTTNRSRVSFKMT